MTSAPFSYMPWASLEQWWKNVEWKFSLVKIPILIWYKKCGLGLTPLLWIKSKLFICEGFPKSILCADGKLFTYKILRPILLQFDAVWSWVVFVICCCYGEDDILLLSRMFHCVEEEMFHHSGSQRRTVWRFLKSHRSYS